ncbi:hypothetical protein [Micromonospora craniellae]|uniref:hypothetical protein n=1 Tax=Micromonospora craniellae TaxID=2294034 RepID=UPI00131424FA|nr:hypothetical protein [Micromonospora craniellae]QOC94194.1 hypothetical protein ID554_11665 [Micromonospora craniellae]
MSSTDVAIDGGLDRLRRELDRLRVENVRLPRLLLRGSGHGRFSRSQHLILLVR